MADQASPKPFGRQVFALFILFFGVIIIANTIFIYLAVHSHTGVITKNPYEKGLKFNETLEKAKAQPEMFDKVSYDKGILKWTLFDQNHMPVENAVINVTLIRPIQDGYDFETKMDYVSNGIYTQKLELPLSGQWEAHLRAQWDSMQYQTMHKFQAK